MTGTKPNKSERISPKLRTALDLMVFGDETGKPLDWDVAGRSVQIPARSMRRALERPYVRRYLMERKQVLRASISAKSLRHLDELASQRVNMNAAVRAVGLIEQLDAEAMVRPMSNQQTLGVVIRIVEAPPPTDVGPRELIRPSSPTTLPPAAPPLDHDPIFRDPTAPLRRVLPSDSDW